jgi:hypothetical protein
MKKFFNKKNKSKLFTIGSLVLILSLTVFLACKRSLADKMATEEFNVNAAKEWYYGIFKKTDEYKNQKTKTGLKLPDWKNGIIYKIENIQVVEFPLVQERKFRGLSEKELPDADKRRIVNAVIDKVVFFKMPNGEVKIKIVQFTPTLAYLKCKNYDISENTFIKIGTNFSGDMKVFDWNDNFIKGIVFTNGKFEKTIVKISKTRPNLTAKTADDTICSYYVYEYYTQNCVLAIYGDGYITNDCSESVLTGIDYYEYNCHDNPCYGENITAQCMCENYGVCENNGGDDDPDSCTKREQDVATDLINSWEAESVIDGETSSGSEVYLTENGIEKAQKPRTVELFNGKISFWSWAYSGDWKEYFVKENGQWVWEKLEWLNTTHKTKGEHPPCVVSTVTVTEANYIDGQNNKLTRCNINWTESLNVAYKGGVEIGSKNGSCFIPFYVDL